MTDGDLNERVHELLARQAPAEEVRSFSQFDATESRRASELAAELSSIRDQSGLKESIDRAEQIADEDSISIAKHALKLFITHDPEASRHFSVPSPEAVDSESLPDASEDQDEGGGGVSAPEPSPPEGPVGSGDVLELAVAEPELAVEPAPMPARDISHTTPPEEARLDWYREDPLANDHHHHWHIVYPRDGIPTTGRTQPRQGELFFYMHQQMLARYDTERKIAGLQPVTPFSDYGGAIAEGYELEGYGPRPAGRKSQDSQLIQALQSGHDHADQAVDRQQIELVQNGNVVGTVPLEENILGCELESSLWFKDEHSPAPEPLRYENFHGGGHILIAALSDQVGYGGPMQFLETAIRDPLFYHWHRHIDDFYAAYQDKQQKTDFGEFAAEVEFRGPQDIGLCFASGIAGADQPEFDFDAWAKRELGEDLTAGPLTSELVTRFVRSNIVLPDIPRQVVFPDTFLKGVVHLTHDPFVLVVRVNNPRPEPQEVTIRVFLAHADFVENRRLWIEFDKFHRTLAPGVNIVARPDARSAVIKRKGLTVAGAEPISPLGGETTTWCDCGWPYSLLLPSGESTDSGTAFKLLVAITDWTKDDVGEPETCGSMSFCGARNEYPDRRRMGYPFDRPFEGTVQQTINSQASMTMRDLRIRCATTRPSSN